MSCPEIMLSIMVPTYNHERYIVRALDSIRMQKTQYNYEVLVGEDVSTDNTALILQEYEKLHPGFMTVIYRKEKSPLGNSCDLRHRARGKYLQCLEGDDFWIDDSKIEKQINFLESHPDFVAVAHNCVVVDENSHPNGESYPECKNEIYTIDDYIKGIYPGQLATIMTRNYIRDNLFDYSITEKKLSPGDRLIYYMLVTNGRVFCIQEPLSAYRHVVKGGSSYSANVKYNFSADELWWKELMLYAEKKSEKKGHKYIEARYMRVLLRGIRDHELTAKLFFSKLGLIKHKCYAFFYVLSHLKDSK